MARIPKLQYAADEAQSLIKNQIRCGKSVEQYEFNSQGIADAEERLHAWEKETDELLREMFNTPEVAEEFGRRSLCRFGQNRNPKNSNDRWPGNL